MKRRSALKTLSLGAGYTMTGASLVAFFGSCKSEGTMVKLDWSPAFMSKTESTVIEGILDALLPTTESTPGAKELGIIQAVDNIVNKVFKKKDQDDFRSGLVALAKRFVSDQQVEMGDVSDEHIAIFMERYMGTGNSEEQQRLTKLESQSIDELDSEDIDDYHFATVLSTLKDQGISAYFSNETIATEYLNYDPIPGVYNGCVPVSEVGTTWSLS